VSHFITSLLTAHGSLAMAFTCLCGEDFTDPQSLSDHAIQNYHHLRCGCGHLAGSKKQLLQHRAAEKHDFGFPFTTLVVHWELAKDASPNATATVIKTEQEAGLVCFCLETFPTASSLYEHATTYGHRYRCSCGLLFGTAKQIKQHQFSAQHERLTSNATLEALKGLPGKSNATASSPLQAPYAITTTTGSITDQPTGMQCWCGSRFADLLNLFKHATEHGHGLKCSCGQLFGTKDLWLRHQRVVPHSEIRGPLRLPVLHGLPHGLTAVAVLAALSKDLPSTSTSTVPRDTALATAVRTTKHFLDRSANGRRAKAHNPVLQQQRLKCTLCPNKKFRHHDGLLCHTNAKHNTQPPSNQSPRVEVPKSTTQFPRDHLNDKHSTPLLSEQPPRTTDPKPATVECCFCTGRHFGTRSDLEHHIDERHPSCPECCTQFHDTRNNGQLVSAKQLLSSHQVKKNHCYCFEHTTAFSAVQAYEDHCAAHEVVKNQCGKCWTILSSSAEYVEHCGLDDQYKYFCKTCQKVYGCVRVYSDHCLTEHDLFVCWGCLEHHRSYNAWLEHKKLHATKGDTAENQRSELMDEEPPQQQSPMDEQDLVSVESEDVEDLISFSDSESEIDGYEFDVKKFLEEKTLSGVWTDDIDATLEELLSWDKPVAF